MIPSESLKKDEPGSSWSGRKAGMAVVILVVLAVIGLIIVFLVQPPAGSSAPAAPAALGSPANPAPSHTVQQIPVDTPAKPVDFVIQPGNTEKCGLTCRQLTPTITNTGYEAAHNVCIAISLVTSGGDTIFLNGESSINKCIGTIESGESKSEPIVINADCGFLASKCVQQTLIIKTTATCDEATVQFPDRTIAV
ncbi:MAG: hypothetical protein WCH85_04725 [Methanomicrobiales archaeon]